MENNEWFDYLLGIRHPRPAKANELEEVFCYDGKTVPMKQRIYYIRDFDCPIEEKYIDVLVRRNGRCYDVIYKNEIRQYPEYGIEQAGLYWL